ncbi:MAG: GGDEF domain-containing protein [Dehalococcoidia bacterium]|nr:GGDEF domain-containing protein [Dehalococcoidia bacterium]
MVASLGNKAQLEREALTDELTGPPNRRAFFLELEEMVQKAESEGCTFDVCFIDVDEFKTISGEFAVIFTDTAGLSTDRVSTDMAQLLAELAQVEKRVCPVEVSVEVAAFVRGNTADSLVHRAVHSMYGEKRARAEARARNAA